jgi:hypothetical protein
MGRSSQRGYSSKEYLTHQYCHLCARPICHPEEFYLVSLGAIVSLYTYNEYVLSGPIKKVSDVITAKKVLVKSWNVEKEIKNTY